MRNQLPIGLVLVATAHKSAFEQKGLRLVPFQGGESTPEDVLQNAQMTMGVVTENPADFAAIQAFERKYGVNLQPHGGCISAATLRAKKGTVIIALKDRSFASTAPNAGDANWDRAIATTQLEIYSVVKESRQHNAALAVGANAQLAYETAGGRTR